jgi:cytochrome c-type biogenesis protein CcmF
MAVSCAFFAILMLGVQEANPFVTFAAPEDGRGLNPMLQDPAMIMHPPLLFLGYAGFTIPFAVMVGVLVVGRGDNHWIGEIRRWVIFSWLFLTAGIVLGSWWAYVELGWGGYWAWDPVENASLLPWFTGTALMHSMIVQQHRGMFKRFNAFLIAASFILCIFGTYLTRSGVIQSVHAFPESPLGQVFLVFIIILVLGSAALMVWRHRLLRSEHEIEGVISREGAFLLGNMILVLMMAVTLIGTIFPILSGPFGREITAKPEFYNKVVAPMGLLLAFIMAHGPVLAFGKMAGSKIARDMRVPGIAAVIITIVTAVLFTRNVWALLCTFVAVLGTFAVIVGFTRTVTARHRSTGEGWVMAAIRLIDADKRRYGAQVTHLGVMMIIIGVAGSSLFTKEHMVVLERGRATQVGDYMMTLDALEGVRGPNYDAVQATVTLESPDGIAMTLTPQKRLYDKWRNQPNTEIALYSDPAKDVYLILNQWSERGIAASVKLLISPMVAWIWIGGIVMVLGSFYCMLPRFLPRTQHHAARAHEPARAGKKPAFEPVAQTARAEAGG